MLEGIGEWLSRIIVILLMLCMGVAFFRIIFSKYAPVKTAKAQIVDKFTVNRVSHFQGAVGSSPEYVVVFAIGKKKRSFSVSEFSYKGYKMNKRGTIKYRGNRLMDFK